MDVYVLRFKSDFGGRVISVHGRLQGTSSRMAEFTELEQSRMVVENFELEDLDD